MLCRLYLFLLGAIYLSFHSVVAWKLRGDFKLSSYLSNINKSLLSSRNIGIAFVAATCVSIISPIAISAKVSDEVSVSRFKSSLKELERLDHDWKKYVTNGDDIRRVLGTVYTVSNGCESPLCSPEQFVKKFVRNNMDELNYDKFEGPSSLYLQSLNQADFLAYSSVFAGYGNGGSGIDYIDESHKQVKKAIDHLKDMITVIEDEEAEVEVEAKVEVIK